MTTVRALLTSSIRLFNGIGTGENMSAEEATDSLSALNQLLDSWSADGAVIYNKSTDTKVLSGGVSTYTLGTGGDINSSRPVSINEATITKGNIVSPALNIWSSDVYSTVANPTQQGEPTDLYVNNNAPLMSLKLHPVPQGGETLTLYSMKPLGNLSLNDQLTLPPGYEMALRFNLAVILAPEWEKEASPTVKQTAVTSLGTIKRSNQQYPAMTMAVDDGLKNHDYYDFNRGY